MTKRILTAMALAGIIAIPACGTTDADDDGVISQDTTLAPSVDTIQTQMEVPVQDTVVETTTIDTVGRGEADDDTVVVRP
jgi:hypothetical protein